ncbi:MAG: DUF3990 domain-containing protein, partial [Oscillospiraceae bacterium]
MSLCKGYRFDDTKIRRCSMEHTLTLFHGSPQIIKAPELAKGKPSNDYGRGFYCTESIELAKEWACSTETDGFA